MILVLIIPVSLVCAQDPYVPVIPNPFGEEWRWQEIREVRGYITHAMCGNGVVWYATHSGVMTYDGIEWQRFDSSEFPDLAGLRDIHLWRGEIPVVQANKGIFMYGSGEWQQLVEVRTESVSERLLDEDQWGNLWAATEEGLVRISPERGVSSWLRDRRTTALHFHKGKELWIGTRFGWILRVEVTPEGLHQGATEIQADRVFPRLMGRPIAIDSDKRGDVWAVASRVASPPMRFDRETGQWMEVPLPSDAIHYNKFSVLADSAGLVWISMAARLLCWNGHSWEVFTSGSHRIPFLRYHMNETPDGRLWFGARGSMPYKIEAYSGRWRSIDNLSFKAEDDLGRLWFISSDRRIVRFDPSRDEWVQYSQRHGVIQHPVTLHIGHHGAVWVCGAHDDNAAVSILHRGQWVRNTIPNLAPGVGRETVRVLRNGDVTLGWGFDQDSGNEFAGGLVLARFHPETGFEFEHITPPKVPSSIASIAEDNAGNLYFAGARIEWFNWRETVTVQDYPWQAYLPANIRVLNDDKGTIWVGHWGQGVARFDGDQWRTFTTADGLVSDLVARIYRSPDETIWAATLSGYSRYDEHGWVELALPEHLIGDRGPNELHFMNDGTVWANRLEQSWYQFDDEVGFRQFDRDLKMKTVSYQPTRIPPSTLLNLVPQAVTHEGNVFISWSGRSSHTVGADPDLTYSYRINGGDWSPFRAVRELTLTGLPKGMYKLEVRARDRDLNIDPNPATATFEVAGIVWREPWFVTLIGALALLIAGLVVAAVRMRIRYLVHMEELKVQFFTNISHELRTPLSVIIGPLQTVHDAVDNMSHRHLLSMALRNANHMIRLIDEILEFRRTQSIRLRNNLSRMEVGRFFKDAVAELRPLVDEKGHTMDCMFPENAVWAQVDQAKLLKIFDNLLTNAVKYTPENGKIRIAVRVVPRSGESEDGLLCLKVSDNGVGIPTRRRRQIFQPFYRINDSDKGVRAKGTGIGLALVRELVEIMGGSVQVDSPYRTGEGWCRGASFVVNIPVRMTMEPASADQTPLALATERIPRALENGDDDEEDVSDDNNRRPTVLVVEDDEDIREYLRSELGDDLDILEASNGAQALELAEAGSIDLVLSDVMMPVLDGYGLTRRLREKIETSHIPIILLTAKKSFDAELTGLESGADDYIPKPFNIVLLRQKIMNVLEKRKRMRERFSRQVFIGPKEVAITHLDEKFLNKAMQIIEEHMNDFDFDVNAFARKMGMSRASLYRKFKAISGEAPTMFVRSMRMERAAQFLRSGQFNVSEVVGKVGFLDHSYFCACFKKKFQCTPTEFIQREHADIADNDRSTL